MQEHILKTKGPRAISGRTMMNSKWVKGVAVGVLGLSVMWSAGCQSDAQTGALFGAAAGAAIGAGVKHGDRGKGAAYGAAIGATSGYVIGNESDKQKLKKQNY